MKKILTFKMLTVFCSLIAIVACSKDNDSKDGNTTQTKNEIITEKPWKYLRIEGKYLEDALWHDEVVLDCNKDNLTIFHNDGNITADYGTKKCVEDEPQTEIVYTWKMQEDGKNFTTIDNAGYQHLNKIEELTSSLFVYYRNYTAGGKTYEQRIHLKR